jgi:hypothetical protein
MVTMTEHPDEGQMIKRSYEAPSIVEIGTLQELTMQGKNFGSSDGFTFSGIPIGNS